MLKYIIRRLLVAIPELFIISFMIFMIMYAAPGDFLDQYRLDPSISAQTLEAMRKEYGLDQPAIVQYLTWLKNLFKGNMGYSFYYRRPVSDLIWERVNATLILSVSSLLFSWALGIITGIYSALKKYSFGDRILTVVALGLIATPSFFLGLLMLYLAAKTNWFPISGMISTSYNQLSAWDKFKDILWHMILPVSALSSVPLQV